MLRSALSVFLFCLLGRLDCKDLTAKRGENATLECFGSKDATEVMIEWRKSDSHSGVSVIKFRDGNFTEHAQHDLFKGRVMPKDPNWKETEDFSVILMYVIMNDTGTYKCKAGYGEENDIKVLNTTNLTVESNITNITAVSGKNQILQCQNPNNDLIITVRWSRADQEPKHVVLYQKREFDLKEQHPSFKDRVDLQNRQMKDGDVSLILKGVTDADAGTYESRVIWKGTNHMKRADLETDPICIINLSVAPAGQPGGYTEDEGKKDGGKVDREKMIRDIHFYNLASAVFLLLAAVLSYLTYRIDQAREGLTDGTTIAGLG